jgi:hypothetical protein
MKYYEGWRTLHNEELHNLYSSSNILRTLKSRTIIWMGYVVRMGECIRTFRGKTLRKEPITKTGRKRKDSNKMDV